MALVNENLDLASLLDADVSDLADLKPMAAPPAGFYNLGLKIETCKINDKDAVRFSCVVRECLEQTELNDSTGADIPPAVAGQQFSEAFILGSDIAIGRMKAAIAPIGEAVGLTKISDIIAATSQGIEIAATVKRRADKDDKEKFYASLSNVTVL